MNNGLIKKHCEFLRKKSFWVSTGDSLQQVFEGCTEALWVLHSSVSIWASRYNFVSRCWQSQSWPGRIWRGWWESCFTEDPAFLWPPLVLIYSALPRLDPPWISSNFPSKLRASMPLHSCFSFYQNSPSFIVILCKVKSFPRELLKSSFSLHSYPHTSVSAFSSDIVLDAPSPIVPEKALPG